MRRLALSSLLLTCCSVHPAPKAPEPSKEPTFWEICYRADGSIERYDGECAHPEEITWKLPVRVHLPRTFPDRLAALEAMKAWNDWLGVEVYRATDDPVADADLEAALDNPFWAGIAEHDKSTGVVHFNVRITMQYTSRVDVIAHELGHVLGLAHDPGRHRSIMDPGPDWYLPAVTQADCRALAAKYHLARPPCLERYPDGLRRHPR